MVQLTNNVKDIHRMDGLEMRNWLSNYKHVVHSLSLIYEAWHTVGTALKSFRNVVTTRDLTSVVSRLLYHEWM